MAYFGPPIIRINNKYGEPALVYAVRNKRENMVEVLLKSGIYSPKNLIFLAFGTVLCL